MLGWLSISAAASPPLRLRAASVRRATTLRGMPPSPPLPPAAAKGPTIVRISPSNTHHLLPLSRTYLPPAILRSNAVSDHTRVVSTVDPTPHTHTSARAFSYPTYYPHHARVVDVQHRSPTHTCCGSTTWRPCRMWSVRFGGSRSTPPCGRRRPSCTPPRSPLRLRSTAAQSSSRYGIFDIFWTVSHEFLTLCHPTRAV